MSDPFAPILTDLIDQGKLPENFDVPGQRPPVNRGDPQPPKPQGWDHKPATYIIKGKVYEFFTIRHLCAALGKAPSTVRAWEARGMLPPSPFRSPTPRRQTLEGKTNKGKRLWTREQIEGILRVAAEEQVILNGGPPPNPSFTYKTKQLFYNIYTQSDLVPKDTQQ